MAKKTIKELEEAISRKNQELYKLQDELAKCKNILEIMKKINP